MTVEERLRAIYERFNAGDVEGVAALFAPDAVVIDAAELPGSSTYRGRAEVAEGFGSLHDMFTDIVATVEELRVSDERAVALIAARASSAGAGVPVQTPIGHVFRLHEGDIVEMRVFLDHAQALEAYSE